MRATSEEIVQLSKELEEARDKYNTEKKEIIQKVDNIMDNPEVVALKQKSDEIEDKYKF